MLLEYRHPEVAQRDCSHCLIYHYNEETGQPYEGRDGQPAKRHWGCKPPCQTSTGCPKGTPEDSKALTERNRKAVLFHRECQALGQFPEDAIVRQNAGLIALFDRMTDQIHRAEVSALLKVVTRNA